MDHEIAEGWRWARRIGRSDFLTVFVAIAGVALIAFALRQCRSERDFVYAPPTLLVLRGGDPTYESPPEIRTSSYWKNFQRVLEWHGEEFQVGTDGQVLIRRKLASDRELLANYHAKAMDAGFLRRLPNLPPRD